MSSSISELTSSIQERMYGLKDDVLYPIAIKPKYDKKLFIFLGCFLGFIFLIVIIVILVNNLKEEYEEKKEEEKK